MAWDALGTLATIRYKSESVKQKFQNMWTQKANASECLQLIRLITYIKHILLLSAHPKQKSHVYQPITLVTVIQSAKLQSQPLLVPRSVGQVPMPAFEANLLCRRRFFNSSRQRNSCACSFASKNGQGPRTITQITTESAATLFFSHSGLKSCALDLQSDDFAQTEGAEFALTEWGRTHSNH